MSGSGVLLVSSGVALSLGCTAVMRAPYRGYDRARNDMTQVSVLQII